MRYPHTWQARSARHDRTVEWRCIRCGLRVQTDGYVTPAGLPSCVVGERRRDWRRLVASALWVLVIATVTTAILGILL